MSLFWMLLAFGAICYLQNMSFTWSSRSRNSGDPSYHRKASYSANFIYYITNALMTIYIVRTQTWWALCVQGLIYTISTSEGSVAMMKWLLKKEKGKRQVGAVTRDEFDELKQTVNYLAAHQIPTPDVTLRIADAT